MSSAEYELSHQDSLTAISNGLIVKNKIRHTTVVPDGESEEDAILDFSGCSGSEEDEILPQSDGDGEGEDEIEKFISKRQMSYPPLPCYESPIRSQTSGTGTSHLTPKEKLGILTPPIEESACNSIKSGRSSRNSNSNPHSTSRHVSFNTHHHQSQSVEIDAEIILQQNEKVTTAAAGRESPVESNMSLSPVPTLINQITNGHSHGHNHITIASSDESDGGQGREEIVKSRNTLWEYSHPNAILPMPDLVLEGLIANFQKIQDLDSLLLFTSEFGSNLKKVQLETIFQNFNDITEILAVLCSSSHFRLNMEAFNATNSFSERLRQLSQSLRNQIPKDGSHDLTSLIKQLCSICGEAKSVLRTEAGATFSRLIKGAGPAFMTESIFSILNQNSKTSPKVKASALDALTLLLLTFPRDNFHLEEVAKEVCSILLSPKRRLRLAALECLAVVAHAMGPNSAMPLFRQLIEQEISNGIRSSTLPRRNNLGGQSSASKAVSARVSRRVLPSSSPTGLINYAMVPLPSSSHLPILKSNQYEDERDADLDLDEYGFLEPIMNTVGKKYNGHYMGADILYVLRGSGAATQLTSNKSLSNGSMSSSSSSDGNGKVERSMLTNSRLQSMREPDLRREMQIEEGEIPQESSPFSGFSRVSPFNGPNVIKQQDLPLKFMEKEVSPSEFRYRYSTNDLRNPAVTKPVTTFEYPRRGSEGYTNVNVRRSTPFPNLTNEFTVMTMEHSTNHNHNHTSNINYNEASKYLNGNHNHNYRQTQQISDDDEDIDENQRENDLRNFVDESEEIESKKSSAGSSTRDSGVSSLKSACRMLPNDSPPSTGDRGEAEEEEDDVDADEIPISENENDNEDEEQKELPMQLTSITLKSPSAVSTSGSRGSGSVRSPMETKTSSPRGTHTVHSAKESEPEEEEEDIQEVQEQEREESTQSHFRPVQNSPPPTPRLDENGELSDFILRKPVLARSTSKKKLAPSNFQNRASTSPSPYRLTSTSLPQAQNSYVLPDENGQYRVESRNGYVGNNVNYINRTEVKTPETPTIDDLDDDIDEDVTDAPSANSRESASSRESQLRGLGKQILPPKCKFLKKGVAGIVSIAPHTRKIYKGSFRESNVQGRVALPVTNEVFPPDMKPLDSPKHGLHHGLQKLAAPEWETNIDGFRLIVRLIRYNQEFLLKPPSTELHNIILSGLRQLGNLRSQVCRAACLFFKELFTHLDPHASKAVEQDMEKISEKLLDKSMDTNKFIREDSGSALDAMVMAMSPHKCINVLDSYGTKHRNAIVRKTTARLLGLIVKKLGPERILNEHPEKTLPMLVRFLQEGNLETRIHAKSTLSILASSPSFDTQLRRNVPLELLRHSDKAINSLKKELKYTGRTSTLALN